MVKRHPRECSNCGSLETCVCDSRNGDTYIRRSRKCPICGTKNGAYEISEEEYKGMKELVEKFNTLRSIIDDNLLKDPE